MNFKIQIIAIIFAFHFCNLCEGAEQYQTDALNRHNALRAKHSARNMVLDENLNRFAVKCAGEYAGSQKMDHHCAHDLGKGENIAWKSAGGSPSDTIKAAIDNQWYAKEKPKYDFNKPGPQNGTGHFTQVIWDASTKLGCGVSTKNGRSYSVCLYDPAGNMNTAEAFKKNVKPN